VLRDQNTIEKLDLGSAVELSHLRSEITFEGSLSLEGEDGEVVSIYGEGRGKQTEDIPEPLSQIIDELNERFGLNLNERDQLFFDQIEGDWLADPDLTAQARNNSVENFRLVFDRSFVDTVARRVMDNEDIAKRFFDDEEFKQVLIDWYAEKVYRRARDG
jgi:type I restriction enzyme R subunit